MPIDKVGVVGAGLMGSEIALVFALAGKEVLLNDVSEANLTRALDNLGRILDRGAQRGFYTAEQKVPTLARIRATTELAPYADRDLVIEAVFEDETVKADTFRRLDQICKADCLIKMPSNDPFTAAAIVKSMIDGVFCLAWPSRRFRSAWMGIIVHSSQTVFFIFVALGLVLGLA